MEPVKIKLTTAFKVERQALVTVHPERNRGGEYLDVNLAHFRVDKWLQSDLMTAA